MKFRKYIPVLLTLIIVLFVAFNADAQCAMCKGSAKESEYAKSLNRGIEYLLLAPFVVLGTVVIIWIRNKDKFASKQ